jgi:dTDP-4-amino-4,6-dideoxygalactose transaminase
MCRKHGKIDKVTGAQRRLGGFFEEKCSELSAYGYCWIMADRIATELKVPLIDLKTQYANLRAELLPEILECLDQAVYIDGEAVRKFESSFAAYCETDFCVGLASGTAALHLALLALDIGPGDEVIVPANTFIATAAAVSIAGARVVLADSSPATWLIDPNDLEDKITPRTRAVIAVHLYGCPADLAAIAEICARRKILLIEDAAQAHGARYHGRRIGSFGEVACFSFYPSKNLGAFGDAGAITTRNRAVADRIRSLSNHGRSPCKDEHTLVGYNYRMSELQGIVLEAKLKKLEGWNASRRTRGQAYRDRLASLPIEFYQVSPGCEAVYHLMAICCDENHELAAYLKGRNIETRFHYPLPVHLQPAFQHLGLSRGSLPVAERIARRTLSLPMFPEMTDDQFDHVCASIRNFYS